MCKGTAKQVSAGVAPSKIKSGNLLGYADTGLKKLFLVHTSSAILDWTLEINRDRLVVPVSDWLTQHRATRPSETNFRKW